MELYLGAPPPEMTAEEYLQSARSAAEQWSHTNLTCSGLSIDIQAVSQATADVGFDGKNMIVFYQDSWSKHPLPADPAQVVAYAPNAFAVTTIYKSKTTGEIVDADMEINAVRFLWADLVTHPDLGPLGAADFQNTLTHELGHVIGLAHPCYSQNDGPTRLTDNNGNPELDCKDPAVPASVSESTMFPAVATSDTLRRTLAADDQQAVCDIYPSTSTRCGPSQSDGCSLVGRAQNRPQGRALLSFLEVLLASLLWKWMSRQTMAHRRPMR
jgi:hypothetical protein